MTGPIPQPTPQTLPALRPERLRQNPTVFIVAPSDLSADLGLTVLWRDEVRRVMFSNLEKAVEVARVQRPKVVVVGGLTPDAATAAVRRLRQGVDTRTASIVVVSTSCHFDDEQRLRAAGANVVLPMPVDPLAWDGRLEELLRVPQRRAARIPVRFSVWTRTGEDFAEEGLALNVSVRGMLLETSQALEEGRTLDLSLALPGLKRELRAVGHVVRTERVTDGRSRAGIEFVVLRGDAHRRLTTFVEGRRAAAAAPEAPAQETLAWESELRASESRKAAILDSAIDCIVTFDHEGRIREFNRAAETTFGYHRSEVIGRTVAETIVPPALRNAHRRAFLRAVAPGRPVPRDRRLEMAAMRADGSEFPAELTLTSFDFKGRTMFTAYLRDVTERVRAEEEKHRLEEQLRQGQRIEAVGRLAGGVAHDFNNLLAVILGYANLALGRGEDAVAVRRDLEHIRRASERAAALTRQLLAFSRRQVLVPEVLDLGTVVAEMRGMLTRLIGEDIEVITDVAPDLGPVKADPGQLEQVLMNLAVNARDALPGGGVLHLALRNVDLDAAFVREHLGSKEGAHVLLEVSDSGLGMDEDVRSRIFEPFFTTKEKGKGTGLGLATVYGIVKQSGGYIDVDAGPGRGATFRIYLPRVSESPLRAQPAPVEGTTEGTETVLLVEDDAAVRAMTREVLESYGYRVLEARSGSDAIRVSRGHSGAVALLLTDVVMPQMSGRAVADELSPERPEMKVLYASGYTDDAIVQHGVLNPGTEFLQKPFTPDTLARRVRALLDRG